MHQLSLDCRRVASTQGEARTVRPGEVLHLSRGPRLGRSRSSPWHRFTDLSRLPQRGCNAQICAQVLSRGKSDLPSLPRSTRLDAAWPVSRDRSSTVRRPRLCHLPRYCQQHRALCNHHSGGSAVRQVSSRAGAGFTRSDLRAHLSGGRKLHGLSQSSCRGWAGQTVAEPAIRLPLVP